MLQWRVHQEAPPDLPRLKYKPPLLTCRGVQSLLLLVGTAGFEPVRGIVLVTILKGVWIPSRRDLSASSAILLVTGAGQWPQHLQSHEFAKSLSFEEAPVRIELTNSRFAVCRLTTWPRRRATKLSGPEPPEQSRREYA
jgi:hypothetical protein